MPIKTFRGKLAMGLQKRLHLSTSDGLTGYRITKFQIMNSQPGQLTATYIGQAFVNDQSGSISATVDFNHSGLMAVCYVTDHANAANRFSEQIIFDKEVFNQDLYVNITDADGGTVEANYYIELEQIKLNINESTFATLKNIRDSKTG